MLRIIVMVIYVSTVPSWASKYETTGTKHTKNDIVHDFVRALFSEGRTGDMEGDDDNFSNQRSHFQMLNTLQSQTSNDRFYPSLDLSEYGHYVKRSF